MILLQDRRDKHNQGNVERESGRTPIPVNAEDLVQVGREGRGDETMRALLAQSLSFSRPGSARTIWARHIQWPVE